MNGLSNRLLKNYLLGKCTSAQLEEIQQWMEESDENAQFLFRMEQLYLSGKDNPYADDARIQQAEMRLIREIIREEEERSARTRSRFLQIAASLALLTVVAVFGTLYVNKAEILEVATANEIKEIMLPDSTRVWLNANSLLRYPANFSKSQRKVELEGEAMFCVTHNEQKPFSVSSKAMQTTVLGTEFNFSTRGENNTEVVTLLKGSVMVEGLAGEGKIKIEPDQRVVLDKTTHAMQVEKVYSPLAAVWHNNMIPFRNQRISTIVSILENHYKVNIHYSGLDNNATYSGDIRRMDSIASVLEDLSYSIPFTFRVKGKEVMIIGK